MQGRLPYAHAALFILLHMAVDALPSGTCASRRDCSYNGACLDGSCKCKPQFTGDQCDIFSFAPLDLSQGTGLQTVVNGSQVSSWGGSVLLADDGRYHMWAAEMSEHTGIKAWITNSRIVHAVSSAHDPQRPPPVTSQFRLTTSFAGSSVRKWSILSSHTSPQYLELLQGSSSCSTPPTTGRSREASVVHPAPVESMAARAFPARMTSSVPQSRAPQCLQGQGQGLD